MRKPFKDIASIGVISDTDPRSLPENAWTGGRNVRFKDNAIEKMYGESSVYTTPAIDPYWLLPVQTESAYYWLYPSLAKCYVTDGTTNTNITRQSGGVDVDYSGDADLGWNGGVIGNVPVINNGVDDPQMWTPVGTGTKLQSLTWSSGQTWSSQSKTAKTIRVFGDVLVALNTTESGTVYRQRMRWSHPASSGAVPSTWDETDTTKKAGLKHFDEDGGSLIDCLPLRDSNIVYKEGSTYSMRFVGGVNVFDFDQIFSQSGLLTTRCAKPFFGKHFVVTQGDIIVHDGSSIEPVADNKVKKELFALIDSTNYQRTFVSPNYQRNEMWICFPESGASFATLALVWNFRDNTFTYRELPTVKHIGYGLVDPSGADTWDSDSGSWDADPSIWGQLSYSPTVIKNLMAGSTLFYLADDTNQSNGTNVTAYIERLGLDFGDPERVKHIKRIWPRIDCTGDITISVGSQMEHNDAVTWKNYTYSNGSPKVDVDVSGRLIAVKFSSNTNVHWSVYDFDIEYDMRGYF